jgi:hypothetical protein
MKNILLIMSVFGVLLLGCNNFVSKDVEVESYLNDLEELEPKLSSLYQEGKIEEAKKLYNERKGDLEKKHIAVMNAKEFQLSKHSRRRLYFNKHDLCGGLRSAEQLWKTLSVPSEAAWKESHRFIDGVCQTFYYDYKKYASVVNE